MTVYMTMTSLVDLLRYPETFVAQSVVTMRDEGVFFNTANDVQLLLERIKNARGPIHVLDLGGNSIGQGGADAIKDELAKLMDLKCLPWDDIFRTRSKQEIPNIMKTLLRAVEESGAKLTYLNLADNAVGPVGIEGLKDFLVSPAMYSLQYLNLNNGGWGSSSGEIAKRLMRCHSESCEAGEPLRLRVFIAGRSRFEHIGAVSMAQAFKQIGTLEYISMPQNGIYHEGIAALAESFAANAKLQYLDLSDNTITAKGAVPLAKALLSCNELEELLLADCLLRSRGLKSLLQTLRLALPKLKVLNLSGNELSASDALEVIKVAAAKPAMMKLHIDTNNFGEQFEMVERKFNETKLKGGVGDEDDDQGEPESEEEEEEEEESDVAEALAKLTACHVVPADEPSPLRPEPISSPRQSDENDRQSRKTTETPQQATSGEMSGVRECAREITQRLKAAIDAQVVDDQLSAVMQLAAALAELGDRIVVIATGDDDLIKRREIAYSEAMRMCDAYFARYTYKMGAVEAQSTILNQLLAHMRLIKPEDSNLYNVRNSFGVMVLISDLHRDGDYFSRQVETLDYYFVKNRCVTSFLGTSAVDALVDCRSKLNLPKGDTIVDAYHAQFMRTIAKSMPKDEQVTPLRPIQSPFKSPQANATPQFSFKPTPTSTTSQFSFKSAPMSTASPQFSFKPTSASAASPPQFSFRPTPTSSTASPQFSSKLTSTSTPPPQISVMHESSASTSEQETTPMKPVQFSFKTVHD